MNHKKYKENLQFYALDELNEQEAIELENHLFQCQECTEELESLKKFNSIIIENKPVELSDSVLDTVRTELYKKLRSKRAKKSVIENLLNKFKNLFFNHYGAIIGSMATLVIGFILGYSVLQSGEQNINSGINLDNLANRKININNIRFVKNKTSEDIEIMFDEIHPAKYTGNMNDLIIQELLATAVVKAKNPGVRIKSLQTISEKNESQIILDTRIKKALITAIEVDDNPGVRREAITLLKKYPYDDEIRDALVYVLLNDKNSGLRVAAINALSQFKIDGISIDKQLRSALDQTVNEENTNQFVKLRATSLLQGEK